MPDLDELIELAIGYDEFIVDKYKTIKNFQKHDEDNNIGEYVFNSKINLQLIGNGSCAVVYKFNDYVIKFCYPGDMNILLVDYRFYPYEKYDEESNEFVRFISNHFLHFEFVSENGLSGIQPYAQCDNKSQNIAKEMFADISERLIRLNYIDNYGLYNGRPVYVDWE